ncbi:MAG: hypothetical protein ABSF99_08170 [Anaerolineales bacterium]
MFESSSGYKKSAGRLLADDCFYDPGPQLRTGFSRNFAALFALIHPVHVRHPATPRTNAPPP